MSPERKKGRKPAEEGGTEEWVTRSVRIPKPVLDWLDGEAQRHRRSTNQQLAYILERLRTGLPLREDPAG